MTNTDEHNKLLSFSDPEPALYQANILALINVELKMLHLVPAD